MKVVNLFGGPGAGKSTIASGLFYKMKMEGHNVELVTEFARDEINSGNEHMLKHQDWLFVNQNHRIRRLQERGVDWVITDSPLLLILIYVEDHWIEKPYMKTFQNLVYEMDQEYYAYNYFIQRQSHFDEIDKGRVHSFDCAIKLDDRIHTMLKYHKVPFTSIPANELACEAIYNLLTYDK